MDDTERFQDLIAELRDESRIAAQSVHHVAHRTFVSRGVQKTVITTTLLIIGAVLLYVPAVLGYFVFYYKYIPDQVTTVPVHLQYGVGPNPFGIAAFSPRSRLLDRQPYDITVSLTLPRSPANLNRGNFMVAMHLLSDSSDGNAPARQQQQQHRPLPYITPSPQSSSPSSLITRIDLPAYLTTATTLFTSTRPALIPYSDPLASLATRVLLLGYHVLFPRRAGAVRLAVPVAEQLSFPLLAAPASDGGGSPLPLLPTSLLLEVQAGQEIQVYDASVTFTARLRGLRWFMYNWWGTAFAVFTLAFWAAEVAVMVGVLMAVGLCLRRTKPGLWEDEEEEEGAEEEGGVGDGEDGGDGGKVGGAGKVVKDEKGKDKMADVPAAGGGGDGGGSSRQKRVKIEEPASTAGAGSKGKGKEVKREEEEGPMTSVPDIAAGQAAGEADDEGEMGESSKLRDVGVGTSYSSQASKEGARKRVSGRRASQ